ncbi:hypothetical protein BGZ63DRAFT_350298 [Mariannaea sp. PMI_226]|nr:hypothetical protein BGZ63DRAFT_350298 [Mariannaea sp. PMI_226]
MLERISSLKDLDFFLCSAVSAYLKVSDSAARGEVKALIAELRLLGGTLYSLEQLISELREDENEENDFLLASQSAAWPVVDGCEFLLQALISLHTYIKPLGLRDARSTLVSYRLKFGFILGSSETLRDVFIHFSVLEKEPMPRLPVEDGEADVIPSPSQPGPIIDAEDPTLEEMCSWLDIISSPEYSYEPEEYASEMARTQARRLTSPLYRTASIRWPAHAETHWLDVRVQICTLFKRPMSFNFVQWALEYARETYPRTFGSLALNPKRHLELTNALCKGSISPLHIAAALGLPSLCKALILFSGANVNEIGLLGSPLFCAFVGPNVLNTRAEPESWSELLGHIKFDEDRATTILALLSFWANRGYCFNWRNAGEVRLAGIAFWAALAVNNEDIFIRVVEDARDLDAPFLQLLEREDLINLGLTSKSSFARLLTYIFDMTMSSAPGKDIVKDELGTVIRKLMKDSDVDFSFKDGNARLSGVDDKTFDTLVRESVVDPDEVLFRRLLSDPRFNPDLPSNKFGAGETILHLAIEGGHVEIMDHLIKAGASLEAKDARGRTPFMVVDNPATLSKLVLEHGAKTTDVDIDGRTIWHYAAATNSDGLLKWLIENDPNKQRNMCTTNKHGATPLADAFLYVHSLMRQHRAPRQIPPTTLRRFLKEKHTPDTMKSPFSLLAYAVEWGEVDLLESLLKLGYQHAENDRSLLLRRLHLGVSDQMLQKVLDMSKGVPLTFPGGSSVFESLFVNTVLRGGEDVTEFMKPTAHPSCYPRLSQSMLDKLLTPEVLRHKDLKGRGIWQRFCDFVLPKMRGRSCVHPARLFFLSTSISDAIRLLVQHGALDDFEERHDRWALLYMADGEGLHPAWERYQFPFIRAVLETVELDKSKFLQTVEGAFLLAQALRRGQMNVVRLLIDSSMHVGLLLRELGNESLLEHFITEVKVQGPLLHILVGKLEPGFLVERQHRIFEKLLELPASFSPVEVVKELLAKNLIDPNKVSTDEPKVTMLQEALLRAKPDFAVALLQYGADPTLSFGIDSPILDAVERGYIEVLDKMLDALPPTFDWTFRYEPPGKPSYNALQIAALNGRAEALRWLLQKTELLLYLNDVTPRNGLAPIHLAITARSLECVQILGSRGADLELQTHKGATPLLLAVQKGCEDIVNYLLKSGVDTETDMYGIHVVSGWRPAPARIVQDFIAQNFKTHGLSETEKPDPVKLGHILAEMIACHGAWNDSAFKAILPTIPKEDLMAAVLPCRGCTLLSFAGAHGCNKMMLELMELGFGGFVTGCSKHWIHGYNALHHACFGLLGQLERKEDELAECTLLLIQKCLDVYLDEGILWFQVPCSPLCAVVQFGNNGRLVDWEIHHRALLKLLNHVEAHADRYWQLMVESGFSNLCESSTKEETLAGKLLRFVVNRRCETLEWLEYGGGPRPIALHLLVEGIRPDWKEANVIDPIVKMVELLVNCGAEVDAQDDNMNTALFFAASKGVVPIVKVLLEAGANPNIRDDTGHTPLSQALEWGSHEVVRLLLDHGADRNTFLGAAHIPVYTKYSPRYTRDVVDFGFDIQAAEPGNSSLTTLLLTTTAATRAWAWNRDIDFDRLAAERPPVLFLLLSRVSNPFSIKKLLRRIPPEYRDKFLNPVPNSNVHAMCDPLRRGSTELLGVLLQYGWDCEKDVSTEGSALMFACRMGCFESVKMLVRHGARLYYLATGSRGEKVAKSAPHEAKLYPEIVKWLLVGRHQDRTRIEWAENSTDNAAPRPWAGPRKGAHKLSGFEGHYLRTSSNSTDEQLNRLKRIRNIKREFSGKIVHVTLVE